MNCPSSKVLKMLPSWHHFPLHNFLCTCHALPGEARTKTTTSGAWYIPLRKKIHWVIGVDPGKHAGNGNKSEYGIDWPSGGAAPDFLRRFPWVPHKRGFLCCRNDKDHLAFNNTHFSFVSVALTIWVSNSDSSLDRVPKDLSPIPVGCFQPDILGSSHSLVVLKLRCLGCLDCWTAKTRPLGFDVKNYGRNEHLVFSSGGGGWYFFPDHEMPMAVSGTCLCAPGWSEN